MSVSVMMMMMRERCTVLKFLPWLIGINKKGSPRKGEVRAEKEKAQKHVENVCT